MFLILILLALAAVAIILVARRQLHPELQQNRPPEYLDGESLRPLFAPDDAELRALELEERKSEQEREQEDARIEAEKRLASFYEFRQTWRESATRSNTIELLRRAADIGKADVYLETLDAILHNRATGFSDDDLAQLIESHFWLLPAHERTPGAAHTIKRELAALGGGSAARSEEADRKT